MNRSIRPRSNDSRRNIWRLPVVHSVLSAERVLELVQSSYGLRSCGSCHLLKPALNDTYFIDHAGEPFIARVYGSTWRTASDITYELELLRYLARQGVAVA